eukprot:13417453-Alexandrium_andersonii.AAC.1
MVVASLRFRATSERHAPPSLSCLRPWGGRHTTCQPGARVVELRRLAVALERSPVLLRGFGPVQKQALAIWREI